jgi:CBS domain-containing protein
MPSPLQKWRRGNGWPSANAGLVTLIVCGVFMPTKRLPVIENHRPVGMISEADLARSLSEHQLAEFVQRVYAAP